MTDARFDQRKLIEQCPKTCPRIAFSLTASVQSFEEFPRDLVEIITEALMVSANTVIIPISAQFNVELRKQFGFWQ